MAEFDAYWSISGISQTVYQADNINASADNEDNYVYINPSAFNTITSSDSGHELLSSVKMQLIASAAGGYAFTSCISCLICNFGFKRMIRAQQQLEISSQG